MSSDEPGPIVRFYRGTGRDDRNRSLDEILEWGDDALEEVHDFIQWLFPLDQPSAVNPGAPLVSAADRRAFAHEPPLGSNLRRAFARMLSFYGFELVDGAIRHSPRWSERSRNWLTPHNHNHLRLTRIIKSMTLLGQSGLAQALRTALLEECERRPATIGETTRRFWQDAGN